MTFFEVRQSTAILILSASLGAVPSFAQANTPPAAKAATDTPPVTGKVVEDIVARVNDQIVTQSDYDRASESLDAEAKQQAIPAQQLTQKQADLLRDLIDQQLLLSKAKELGITGETELIKRLDEIRKQNHLESMDDLEKAAQQQGVSYEDFKANIRNGIVTQQVVRDEVGRHITMAPNDVQRYYKAHESEFAQPESVTLNEILIPTPVKTGTEAADPAQVAAAQAQADALMAKIASGAKFDDLAKPAPTDPLAPKSVALGEFRRGMLAKEIEDKAFALKAGQTTQPIRTKQGFIILNVTEHEQGGDASFKKAESQVEEALFLERMQPALRTYLTKLREEAFVEVKQGFKDTGSSGNEIRLDYSAYAPPASKKKKKFARTRFRGRDRTKYVKAAAAPTGAGTPAAPAAATAGAAPATAGTTAATATTATAAAAAPAPAAQASAKAATQQASNGDAGIQKPGKREKIRFGQAPRESLPPSQVATAVAPDTAPGVTTPETRVVNPDGTISGEVAPINEKKTRLSSRPTVKKVKTPKAGDTTPGPTDEELASQKVQNAPLGLDDAQKKAKQKVEKTRLSEKPKDTSVPAPYLGKPESGPTNPAATQHPDPPTNPPAPATGPPDPIPPGAQQP
jgi:peptidyl-prolyl cis-trans isomerase SurA